MGREKKLAQLKINVCAGNLEPVPNKLNMFVFFFSFPFQRVCLPLCFYREKVLIHTRPLAMTHRHWSLMSCQYCPLYLRPAFGPREEWDATRLHGGLWAACGTKQVIPMLLCGGHVVPRGQPPFSQRTHPIASCASRSSPEFTPSKPCRALSGFHFYFQWSVRLPLPISVLWVTGWNSTSFHVRHLSFDTLKARPLLGMLY